MANTNMTKATAGIYDHHVADPLSGGVGRKLTDNEIADILIRTSTEVFSRPGMAWSNLQSAKFRLEQARSRAEGMAGRAFDSDRIFTPSDMSDNIDNILSLELAVAEAENAYFSSVASFRYCLERAKELGVFDSFQVSVWKAYYEHGTDYMSMQQLADRFRVTKSRIQYLTTSTRAKVAFCRAIDSILSDIDFSSGSDFGVCEANTDAAGRSDNPCRIRSGNENGETDKDEYDELALPDFTKI